MNNDVYVIFKDGISCKVDVHNGLYIKCTVKNSTLYLQVIHEDKDYTYNFYSSSPDYKYVNKMYMIVDYRKDLELNGCLIERNGISNFNFNISWNYVDERICEVIIHDDLDDFLSIVVPNNDKIKIKSSNIGKILKF